LEGSGQLGSHINSKLNLEGNNKKGGISPEPGQFSNPGWLAQRDVNTTFGMEGFVGVTSFFLKYTLETLN
jgi:hypothetical protein